MRDIDLSEFTITISSEHAIFRAQREVLGLTQQQTADKARITLRQYQRIESGERSIYSASFRIGVSICKALEIDPVHFLP